MPGFEPAPDEPRLESWKAIAAYLDRNVRTAKRWEVNEGLPVHRHRHLSGNSVYAYSREIDLWRENRKPAGAQRRAVPEPRRPWSMLAAAVALAALASGGGGVPLQGDGAVQQPELVCEGCGGVGHVSRDGRWAVVSNISTGGDIELRDTSTGSTTLLHAKSDALSPAQGGEQTYWPLLSDDASQVAFLFVTGNDRDTQLRVMPARPGADARILVDNPEVRITIPVGWRGDEADGSARMHWTLDVAALLEAGR